jgi:hypothetical protein
MEALASIDICMEAMTATEATFVTEMATTATKTAATATEMAMGHPPSDSPPPPVRWHLDRMGVREGNGPRGGGNNRDVEQVYVKMSAEEKETIKWRMAVLYS